MDQVKTASEIDDEAAEWAVRLESRGDDREFRAELDAWVAADPRRAGALLRAEAGLSYVNRARALGDGRSAQVAARPSRRLIAVGGGFGALAAGVGAVAVMLTQSGRYATRVGEIRNVPLPDGSTATINTDSDVVVAMSGKERKLTLAKGEAWFKVAKDATRPFVVEAGDVRIRAVGTAFSVRRRGDGAEVIVTEGLVEAWATGGEGGVLRVSAGQQALISEGQGARVLAVDDRVEDALAWRDGRIALRGETLAEAASEFNRYNVRKIVIADEDLGREKVIGQFSANDPEAFVKAAASAVGARVAADSSSLRLYRAMSP